MKKILILLAFICSNLIASATNYYVSSSGNDANNGTSTSTSWKTIAKVNSTSFSPGDQILFNRGDTWSLTSLTVPSSGTSSSPITFGNYGSGNLPVINHIASVAIQLTGRQYVVIDGIKITDTSISATDHSTTSKIWYGINLNNSSYITIKNCDISLVGTGIQSYNGGNYVTITNNHIYNLRMVINTSGGNDDFGATAIIVGGSNNTITHNAMEECWGPSADYGYDGGVIELFGTTMNNNLIAYNVATNCNGFLEIGSGTGGTASNNIVSYNKITNCGIIGSYHNSGSFAVTISNTQYYNNDVIETQMQYTKPNVMFASSSGSGSAGMIVLKNNIFWLSSGVNLAGSSLSGAMTHTNNVYRLSSGSLGISAGSTEVLSSSAAVFASTSGAVSAWDLHLVSGSPAIKTGTNVGITTDFDGNALNNPPSIGVYESGSTTAPPPPPPAAAIPVFQSASVANATPSLLEFTYDLSLNNAMVCAASSFAVLINSVAVPASTVAVSGTKVQLTLASAVKYGDIVTLSYTKPATNPLQTATGGIAASFTAKAATNNLAAPVKVGNPVSISMSLSPYYVHKTLNVALKYTGASADIQSLTPETLTITDRYGKLYISKLLITGVTSVVLPLNLHSGVYNVNILSNAIQKVTQRMMVY